MDFGPSLRAAEIIYICMRVTGEVGEISRCQARHPLMGSYPSVWLATLFLHETHNNQVSPIVRDQLIELLFLEILDHIFFSASFEYHSDQL